jgi:hypothetical protein
MVAAVVIDLRRGAPPLEIGVVVGSGFGYSRSSTLVVVGLAMG